MPRIQQKRTNTTGKVPAASDFLEGEIILNTPDGRMFIKQTLNNINSVVEMARKDQIVNTNALDVSIGSNGSYPTVGDALAANAHVGACLVLISNVIETKNSTLTTNLFIRSKSPRFTLDFGTYQITPSAGLNILFKDTDVVFSNVGSGGWIKAVSSLYFYNSSLTNSCTTANNPVGPNSTNLYFYDRSQFSLPNFANVATGANGIWYFNYSSLTVAGSNTSNMCQNTIFENRTSSSLKGNVIIYGSNVSFNSGTGSITYMDTGVGDCVSSSFGYLYFSVAYGTVKNTISKCRITTLNYWVITASNSRVEDCVIDSASEYWGSLAASTKYNLNYVDCTIGSYTSNAFPTGYWVNMKYEGVTFTSGFTHNIFNSRFIGCTFDAGLSISSSGKQSVFSDCKFGHAASGGSYTVTIGSGTTKLVFIDCFFEVMPVNNSGNTHVFLNCYLFDGTPVTNQITSSTVFSGGVQSSVAPVSANDLVRLSDLGSMQSSSIYQYYRQTVGTDTDGDWRTYQSTTQFITQLRVSGAWITKSIIS